MYDTQKNIYYTFYLIILKIENQKLITYLMKDKQNINLLEIHQIYKT